MAITLLYGCCQIETAARDLHEARAFFQDALGAAPIERELAHQIDSIAPDTSYRCDHLGLGEAVFQINQPDPNMIFNGHRSIHQAYLDSIGPCVTNLNFFIDDHVHAKDLLLAMGSSLHLEGPSSSVRALADYGPDNTRAGGDERPFLFIGSRSLIGLDLEIMEPNFLRFSEQTLQFPAFVHPRPAVDGGDLTLRRLRIVVPSIDETWNNIERLFTPGCRSRTYGYRAGPLGRAMRITLGGLEIEYCQPAGTGGHLAKVLEEHGAGVVAAEFAAHDIQAAARRGLVGARTAEEPDWLGTAEKSNRAYLPCRDPIGFDVIFETTAACLNEGNSF